MRKQAFLKDLALGSFLALSICACSLFTIRPTQEMNDASAAIRAAREVNAEGLSPELYRQANEWFFKAKNEYKFKNFSLALEYVAKAKEFAERAEFEAVRAGASRVEANIPDPMSNAIPPPPVKEEVPDVPPAPAGLDAVDASPGAPPGRPAVFLEQEQKQQEQQQKQLEQQQAQQQAQPQAAPPPPGAPPPR